MTTNIQYSFQLKGLKDKYIRELNAIATLADKDITITVETSSPVRVVFTLVYNVKSENIEGQDDKTTCLKNGVCETVVNDAMTQEVDKDGKIIMVLENDIEDPESETHTEGRHQLNFTIQADGLDAYQTDTSGEVYIQIHITDFEAPIQIKVGISQTEWDLVTLFTVFFACFLSLLVAAFMAWRMKSAFHKRQAQELEMR